MGYTLNFRVLLQYSNLFFSGVILTAKICLGAMIISFFLGIVLAIMRQSKQPLTRGVATVWVEILRNTPFLIQLFFFYYGLPQFGIYIDAFVVAIIALGINSSALSCEIMRSGLMAVKTGYYEASAALGFSKIRTFQYVVLPISLRLAFKPLTSNFINLVLTSSVCYGITLMEIMGVAKTVSARSNRPFEIYLILLVAYCVFTYIVSFAAKAIDKKIEIKL
ncbi:MAG: amino acid ABC transporter permease [Christensenellales bacterium]|jgi:His/Glu/Gln/Arg/opine family amino acid ABC transporter permease subunit